MRETDKETQKQEANKQHIPVYGYLKLKFNSVQFHTLVISWEKF